MKYDVGMTPCQKLLKQEGTVRRIESMQQSSATPSLHLWGLRKIVACSQSSSQCLLVSTVFGTVSSLHPTSFFNDFYTCIYCTWKAQVWDDPICQNTWYCGLYMNFPSAYSSIHVMACYNYLHLYTCMYKLFSVGIWKPRIAGKKSHSPGINYWGIYMSIIYTCTYAECRP